MAESVAGAHAAAIGEPAVPAGVSGSDARIDPNAVYSLGSSSGESERLQREADQLATMNNALLDRVGVGPGDCAIDLGCGPRGVIELLHQRVSPGGRVVGLDSDPAHVAIAIAMVEKLGMSDARVIEADARRTGLPADSFDRFYRSADSSREARRHITPGHHRLHDSRSHGMRSPSAGPGFYTRGRRRAALLRDSLCQPLGWR